MIIPTLLQDYKKYLSIKKDTAKDYVDISHMQFVAPASVIPTIFFAKSNDIEKYNTYNEETAIHLKKILGKYECNKNLLPLLDINLNPHNRVDSLKKLNNDILKLLFPKGNISYADYGGVDTFPYIIQEILKNINQHSNAKRVYSYSQRYPFADFIDVGILDDGDTIPGKYDQVKDKSFNENGIEFYDVENDCEAIFRSLNGISTKETFINSRSIRLSKSVDDVLNSGDISLGINSSIRLVTEGLGGSFLIASREGICHISNGKANFINAKDDPMPGTFVCMRFERKFLQPTEYEEIIYNFDIIDDDKGFKLINNKDGF